VLVLFALPRFDLPPSPKSRAVSLLPPEHDVLLYVVSLLIFPLFHEHLRRGSL